jgi:7-cyano-7-deazaguanine synthase in queuosine biosynthesis
VTPIDIEVKGGRANVVDCFAKTTIIAHGKKDYSCEVRVEYKPFLYRLGRPKDHEIDLLFFGSVVYSIDKLVPRSDGDDNWQRSLNVKLPVADPALWGRASQILKNALRFLTGDNWEFEFVPRTKRLWYPLHRTPPTLPPFPKSGISCVSLFSGGLDSLVGVIDELEEQKGQVLCVSHHDPSGALSDQNRLLGALKNKYPKRLHPIQAYVGTRGGNNETSLRSRSVVFLTLGTYCASRRGLDELLVPENGMIALNPPLTPSRRGACSTRTAHPYFLSTFQKALHKLAFNISFQNPYQFKTKGEIAEGCNNLTFLKKVALESVSCGKRGRRMLWLRRTKNVHACGMCIPCLYRRAALHRINLDTEAYGRDVLTGELDVGSGLEHTHDFRDLISFLGESHDVASVRRLLVAGGVNDFEHLSDYAEMVLRARSELLTWMHNKASAHKLRAWGLP